jgi:hypothetical protein
VLDGLGRKRQHTPDSRVPGFFLRGSASSVMGLVKRMVVLMGVLRNVRLQPLTLYIVMLFSEKAPCNFRISVGSRHRGGEFRHLTELIQLALMEERHATDSTATPRLPAQWHQKEHGLIGHSCRVLRRISGMSPKSGATPLACGRRIFRSSIEPRPSFLLS